MKRWIVAAALASAALLSGCEDPAPAQTETAQPPVEAVPAETPPVAETPPTEKAPSDSAALPPDARASEETVKPESETLFY